MAKISELLLGGDLSLTDEIPANRGGVNVKIQGKDLLTTKLRYPQPINLSGVVVGGAIFDGVSAANITTTLGPTSPGVSDNVFINDGSGYLKSRDINPFAWNTSLTPVTGSMTPQYIPKAHTSNTLIDSAIVESNLNHIGIRMHPTVELTVGGQISATNSISTYVDLSANRNLFIKKDAILGEDFSSAITINGITTFPSASSDPLGVKISGVSLYKSAASTLKVGGKLIVGQLDASTLSDSVITEEAGLLKYRPVNSQVWNTSTTFIEGNGHVNFIPRFASGNNIQDSIICEKLTRIGIGTHSPNHKLTVNGSVSADGLKLTGDYNPDGGVTFGNNVNLYRSDDYVLRTDQNLLIGTIINDNTINDVLTHDNGLVRQRTINVDAWDSSNRIVRGNGTSSTVAMFLPNAVIADSNITQTGSGDIEVSQKLFVGSSSMDVEQEINDLKSVTNAGCVFYSVKQNDGSTLNPNIPIPLFTYTELNPPRTARAFTSIDNQVVLFNSALITYPGTTIDTSLIEAFAIKFRVKARLERPNGSVEIQVRRKSTEPWVMNSGIINLFAEDFGDSCKVFSSTTEIIYHDKNTGTFEWRLLDLSTDQFLAPFSVLDVKYEVSAEVLGFYFNVT